MDEETLNPDIRCHVCGENEFENREGFYYCRECGVKQEQVHQVEVETADAFNETSGMRRQTKRTKIITTKAEKPQLTSWECYNYILRGFVDELLSMGAKEELKLMALQVWAAYLHRMEVAFFNKKHAELPKLGIRYLKNDAETIYNHSRMSRKKRKLNKGSDVASGTSAGNQLSLRDWRKSKRKLDESMYSSAASGTSASQLSASSTSGHSNKAIKLNFNMKARKYYKKKMDVKHLARHEKDAEGLLQCHNQPTASEIGRANNQLTVMSIKQMYAILGIALNLIGDDIQLSDLVRFIFEGHIGWKNILKYFPENIAGHGKELLKKIDFYKYPEKYTEKFLRLHVNLLCTNLNIRDLKMPNMSALVQRYVTELCLPQAIATYAERLIHFLPPRCEARTKFIMAPYEARAMAYIIFILKLIFGLDGQKEQRISHAASKLNDKIKTLNRKTGENRPLLFVWSEWVQYIEMRKKIVSQFNPAFCRQFKQSESPTQKMEEMANGISKRAEEDQTQTETVENRYYKQQYETFRSLLSTLLEKQPNAKELNSPTSIEFKPTLTPGLSYFKTILLHLDNASISSNSANETAFKIPKLMHVDHSQRDMQSYLEVKPLVDFFQQHQYELKVHRLDITKNRSFVGLFRVYRSPANFLRTQRPNFDISEAEYAEIIKNRFPIGTDDLEWKTEYDLYSEKNYKIRLSKLTFLDRITRSGIFEEVHTAETLQTDKYLPLSIDVFNENNMEPLKGVNAVSEPRRNLDKFNIFEGIPDEESLMSTIDEPDSDTSTPLPMEDKTPAPESLNLPSGVDIKSEFIKEATPPADTVDEDNLNFYTSSMDCWIIMGSIPHLSKSQRAEVLDKFPPIFKWLIETCAQTLGIKWATVYEQLLAIEIMFGFGVKDLDQVQNCVYLNYLNPVKDLQTLISTYREIW